MSKFRKRNNKTYLSKREPVLKLHQQIALEKFLKLAIAWSEQNDKKIHDINDAFLDGLS